MFSWSVPVLLILILFLLAGGRRPRARRPALPAQAAPQGRLTHPVDITPGGKYLRCHLCWRDNQKRKMTKSRCIQCKVALCTYGCFESYHS